jgi:uncharacterized protein YggE
MNQSISQNMNQSFSEGCTYNIMTLTGQGQVTAAPNLAVINLGVLTTGMNLEAVQAENARISQAVLRALQLMGVTEVKTFQYTIDKLYDYDNGTQIDRGYSVRNIFEIKTNNMEQIGSIIDTAVNYGANVVDFITFDVSDRDFYYQQALNLAVDNAIQKSRSIAMNLGLQRHPTPTRIVENSSTPGPFRQFQREIVATPIIPGNIMIEAFVTVDFIY